MSSSRKFAAVLLFGALASTSVLAGDHPAGYFGYGRAPTQAEIAGWAISVRPDGQGLPPGKGNVSQGTEIYMDQCSACHGTFGEGAERYPKLVGGSLKGDRPEPTVGSYWPFATTLFDYINGAMPFPAPHQLSADQVYAITAYILNLNNIVDSDFVASRDTLPKVKMPYHDRFTWKDPRPDTKNAECMKSCVDPAKVKIESTAEGKELTPRTTGPLDEMKPK
jgi:S-disulfanyl-L-cysteine oxidoreductase SoxD